MKGICFTAVYSGGIAHAVKYLVEHIDLLLTQKNIYINSTI